MLQLAAVELGTGKPTADPAYIAERNPISDTQTQSQADSPTISDADPDQSSSQGSSACKCDSSSTQEYNSHFLSLGDSTATDAQRTVNYLSLGTGRGVCKPAHVSDNLSTVAETAVQQFPEITDKSLSRMAVDDQDSVDAALAKDDSWSLLVDSDSGSETAQPSGSAAHGQSLTHIKATHVFTEQSEALPACKKSIGSTVAMHLASEQATEDLHSRSHSTAQQLRQKLAQSQQQLLQCQLSHKQRICDAFHQCLQPNTYAVSASSGLLHQSDLQNMHESVLREGPCQPTAESALVSQPSKQVNIGSLPHEMQQQEGLIQQEVMQHAQNQHWQVNQVVQQQQLHQQQRHQQQQRPHGRQKLHQPQQQVVRQKLQQQQHDRQVLQQQQQRVRQMLQQQQQQQQSWTEHELVTQAETAQIAQRGDRHSQHLEKASATAGCKKGRRDNQGEGD